MREEKRSEIIHDALGFLDDEMIEEVENLREKEVQEPEKRSEIRLGRRPLKNWRKWTSLAACICMLILAGGLWFGIENASDIEESPNPEMDNVGNEGEAENIFGENEEEKQLEDNDAVDMDAVVDGSTGDGYVSTAVTLPAYQVNLGQSNYAESDMALFFIYEGRCYVQTCDYMSKDVMGKYVCTTTGLVDEWTEKDGYVELAGSFEADIYTVKGADPEFMLCTVYDDGVVETFVHNNDIAINRGGEILEWLGFEVCMEEYESFCNKGNSCTTEVSAEDRDILDKFFANFAENEVMLRKDISTTTSEEDIYHLVIVTEDGVPLHFELLNGGYVSYYGLNNVCVKVEERVYQSVIDVLENR